MRALWSALVIRSPKSPAPRLRDRRRKLSLRQASRTSACAPARSPWASSARASANVPLAVERLLLAEKARTVAGSTALRPQHRFGAAAQHADRGPARVGGDEGDVAGKLDAVVVAAQDRPFDQLAGHRIADRAAARRSPARSCPCGRAATASLTWATSADEVGPV